MRLSTHPNLVMMVVPVGLACSQHLLLIHGVGMPLPHNPFSTLARLHFLSALNRFLHKPLGLFSLVAIRFGGVLRLSQRGILAFEKSLMTAI